MPKPVKQVLIIDDSLYTLSTHTELVIQAGLQPLTAERGEDAVRIFEQLRPEIILCDIMMPEMDGYEVMTIIKTIDPEVFFYFVSAEMTHNARKRALELGAHGFYQKPIDLQAVRAVVAHYENRFREA